MSVAFDPAAVRPDAALLAAVGERLSLVLASNRRFAQAPAIDLQARRRIEAVIAGLIEALDELDGDADGEQTATETAGAGFSLNRYPDDTECGGDREGFSDDNGLADLDGSLEQGFFSIGSGQYV